MTLGPQKLDTAAELEKIARANAPEDSRYTIADVFRMYRSMKNDKFFTGLFAAFGNHEIFSWRMSHTCDMFGADVWGGKVFFIIELSSEAFDAFRDDCFTLLKVIDWIVESYKKAVSDMRLSPRANKLPIWDYAFNRHGSPFPDDLFVIPLYDELPSGTPVVVLALVKLK